MIIMKFQAKVCIFVIVNTLLLTQCYCTLTPNSPKRNKEKKFKQEKVRLGPQNYTVRSAKLVSEKVSAKDILANYQAFCSETDDYHFEGLVLGYVTPWNNHGYDIAKIFGNKFTHISPVWLQVNRLGENNYDIKGTHDVDKDWVTHVRNAGRERKLKIVPRVLFDGWTGNDYTKLLSSDKEMMSLLNTLTETCKKWKFNGFVLEVWSQIAGGVPFNILVNFIRQVGDAFLDEKLDLIVVVPPKRGQEPALFTDKHFDALYDHVTAFSLMTYDFSHPQMPGPNAPLNWVEDCVADLTSDKSRRHKILMGLNFYGNDYKANGGGGSIVGNDYVKILEKFNGKLQYENEMAEHFFEYKDNDGRHLVFYPTLYSIEKRIELARELGTGLSVWEIGQGLDYFYDLL